MKTNIRLLENPLGKVKNLTGVRCDWKTTRLPSLGVIAEDVARVLPEVISRKPKTGLLHGVSYDSSVALLVESSKAQGRQIEALTRQARTPAVGALQRVNSLRRRRRQW